MMLSETNLERIAMRLTLAPDGSSWSGVVVEDERLARDGTWMRDALARLGVRAEWARLDATHVSLASAAGKASIVTVEDGEDSWRTLDELRSRLVGIGPKLAILSTRGIEMLLRYAPHLASLFGGSLYRVSAETERTALAGKAELDIPLPTSPQRCSATPSFVENMGVLRASRDDHRGEWVALHRGRLVDHDPSLAALNRRLAVLPEVREILVVKVDERS